MSKRPMRIKRRRKENMLIPVLVMLLFALVLSLGIAAVWQKLSGDDERAASSRRAEDRASAHMSSDTSSEASSALVEPDISEDVSSESEAESSEASSKTQALRVENSYFDDAVFVGDSLTTGIELYGIMENTTVLAGTGLNLDTIYTSEVVKQEDGTRISVVKALEQQQYKKVYIMMGGNELNYVEKDPFIKRYDKFLDTVHELQPDAIVYVQSVLPVTESNNYNMSNSRIDEFNAAIRALCEEKRVYYLDVAASIKDEKGALPVEASPNDGMHFGPEYYLKWFEYLKTHVVEETI
ncbi:MAG: hypothetical protein HFG20_04355 [Anaerotruncus sp.]|nr:hypothetical protein [Anaerotruncus sp.]